MSKRISKLLAVLLIVSAITLCSQDAKAAEASLDAALYSGYIWRGQVINDELVLQPSATLGIPGGLYLNTWGNFDLTDNTDTEGEFSEIDLTVGYALPVEALDIEVGVIEYLFPNVDLEGTREVYAILGSEACPFSPALSAYWDVDEADSGAVYLNAALGHTLVEKDKVSIDGGVSVGYATDAYNDFYFGVDDQAFNDLNFSLTASYAATEAVSVGAEINYMMLLDSEIEDSVDEDNQWWGGVTASYGF